MTFALASVLLAACSGPGEPPSASRGALELDLEAATLPSAKDCAWQAEARASVSVPVRVAVGAEVDDDDARAWLHHAVAFWRAYGVHLETVGPVERLSVDTLLPATELPEGAPDAQLATLLAPLRALLTERHRDEAVVHIVLLARLAPPDGVARRVLPGLRGLTVASGVNDPSDPRRGLIEALGPAPYTDTVFVAVGERPSRREEPGVVLAHEVGHALGLPHHDDPTNLMAVGRRAGCRPVLKADQVAALDLP